MSPELSNIPLKDVRIDQIGLWPVLKNIVQRVEIQKVLRVHLKRIRETSNKKCFIRGDRLIVDGTSYTLDRLDGLDFGEILGSEEEVNLQHPHLRNISRGGGRRALSQEVEQQAGDEITLNEGNAPNQPDDYVLAGGTKKLKALQPIKVRTRSQK
ncbi:hypothetical protein HHI36_003246 [Cryptolaemus montrouzieri]|uniref:Uncharacterized protein n=1 Tax=Cryptolaemus montrouzieri TaxID=559131 RepID=A0ABD2PCX7_9CUCU